MVVKDGTFRLSATPKVQKAAVTSQPIITNQPVAATTVQSVATAQPAATAQSVATAQPSNADSSIVYVTSSGEKYHRETCPTIQNRTNVSSMTIGEAQAHGYDACKVCKP